jgi:hypothetical protein
LKSENSIKLGFIDLKPFRRNKNPGGFFHGLLLALPPIPKPIIP